MPSVQVGAFCYAELSAAAAAACAAHPLTIGASSGGLASSECVGVTVDNTLTIRSGFQPLPCTGVGCDWVYVDTTISPTFAPCWHGDLVDAGLLIMVAFLSAWVSCYGLWRLYKMLSFSRGDV